jgi:membrane protein implicated in regulation of membrane protease activity
VISRTGFLPVGYALLMIVVAIIVGLLFACRFKGTYDEVLLVSFVTLIYVYVVRLIRDLDDPFEYDDGVARGASEIELFPIVEFRERLQRSL